MRTNDPTAQKKPPVDIRYANMQGYITSLMDPEYSISYPVKVIKKDENG